MIVAQQACDVDTISQSSNTQGESDTQSICDAAGKETDHGKGTVEGDSSIVGRRCINLPSTAQSTESVEHARAHEADEGDHGELRWGGGVPW